MNTAAPQEKPRPRLYSSLRKMMTPDERLQFRQLTATVDTTVFDTLPKQQMILDYIGARKDLALMRVGYEVAAQNAAANPTVADHVNNLVKWCQMVSKCETKIDRLRTICGLTAKYEAQLTKAKEIKATPKGGTEIRPWDVR